METDLEDVEWRKEKKIKKNDEPCHRDTRPKTEMYELPRWV